MCFGPGEREARLSAIIGRRHVIGITPCQLRNGAKYGLGGKAAVSAGRLEKARKRGRDRSVAAVPVHVSWAQSVLVLGRWIEPGRPLLLVLGGELDTTLFFSPAWLLPPPPPCLYLSLSTAPARGRDGRGGEESEGECVSEKN